MEEIKRIAIAALLRICFTVFALAIVHHMETIFAFPLLSPSFQTKHSATDMVNSHNEHIYRLSVNTCESSSIASTHGNMEALAVVDNRRGFLSKASAVLLSGSAAWKITMTQPMAANAEGELPDQFNVDDYLKTGMVMNPMGVSGQAGKSKPVTGMYVFHDVVILIGFRIFSRFPYSQQ